MLGYDISDLPNSREIFSPTSRMLKENIHIYRKLIHTKQFVYLSNSIAKAVFILWSEQVPKLMIAVS